GAKTGTDAGGKIRNHAEGDRSESDREFLLVAVGNRKIPPVHRKVHGRSIGTAGSSIARRNSSCAGGSDSARLRQRGLRARQPDGGVCRPARSGTRLRSATGE